MKKAILVWTAIMAAGLLARPDLGGDKTELAPIIMEIGNDV